MIQFDYHAGYYSIEDGWYMARVLDFPGVITQGRDLEKARLMLRSALREMAEWQLEDGLHLPKPDSKVSDPTASVAEPITLLLQLKIETPQKATKAATTPS